ncbi:MAG: hypothetical protein HYS24_03760 [Ignavibacteriales bacterium]|nr:hypothetical protein [Ignavibacteriales bacterium]
MKKFFLLILFSLPIYSQVIISPYVVYMDEGNKFGSMIIQNESFDPYEISISFIFGFPVSDSLGNRSMQYLENPTEEYPALNNWITAFPKKFILNSKERQTIRLMVKPPKDIAKRTYWTRIVTSSTPINKDTTVNSGNGVSAKLKFVLNQVTTAIYRTDSISTDLNIENVSLIKDSTDSYQLLYKMNQLGNSPYFGNFKLEVKNSKGEILLDEQDYLSVYYNITRNYVLPKEKFTSGNYTAKYFIKFNEKEDIPDSKLIPTNDITNNFEFTIP